jgi:selenocysteine lyase/cysteine desulfurase
MNDDSQFRYFHEITDATTSDSYEESKLVVSQQTNPNFQNNIEKLRSDIIGHYSKFSTPFGDKPLCYVDWTASGRSVTKIEDYISSNVLSFYGNTHTTTSVTGHQSTCFRHEARQIIAQAVNAKITGRAAEDVVIFTGNGSTDAFNKIVMSLGLHLPLVKGEEAVSDDDIPIVFISSYEHHSNILPWYVCIYVCMYVAC